MTQTETSDPHGTDGKPSVVQRLNNAKEVAEATGVEFPGLTPFLWVWHRFGLKGLVFIILFVGFPAGEYSALRYAVYSGLPATVGSFGLRFTAEEWALSPFRMKATARHVKVAAPSGDTPVFTASEVEFQGSAWTLLRGLPDMLTFHVFGGTQPFNEIVVRHGELHLERSLTGHLNLADAVEAVPETRIEEALEGVYRVEELALEDFRLSYVEHLPGGSADGIVRTAEAQVTLEQIGGYVRGLEPPEKPGARPTRFKLNGRSAAGVFEVSGSAALFAPEGGASEMSAAHGQQVSLEHGTGGPRNPYELSVYLENIAAAAYGQMVPVTTILPVNGIISGKTTVVHDGLTQKCTGGFTMKDVRFAPNPLVVTQAADVEVVRRLVANVVYTGPFEICGSGLLPGSAGAGSSGGDHPAALALANLTQQATATASPSVKAIVDRDRRIMAGDKQQSALSPFAASLAQQMGYRLGGTLGATAGAAAAESLVGADGTPAQPSATPRRNPVVGRMSKVGTGIKRFFGGGKKP